MNHMKKTVYFVRHGETRSNKTLRHERVPAEHLDRKGREEAHRAGDALALCGIKKVYTSSAMRARETAEIIGAVCGATLFEEMPSLEELHRPLSLHGAPLFSFASLWYGFGFIFGRASVQDAGGETLYAFKTRLENVLTDLAARPEAHSVVVTHRGVMSGLTPLLRRGGRAPLWRFALAFLGVFGVDNAEITIATYDGMRWHLVALNENEHL